jgi:REP-associated tyrosine transposase
VRCAHAVSRMKSRELGLWQRRFWEHQIGDEGSHVPHVVYVNHIPVKHGLVTRVADWRYSTFHRDVRLGDRPPEWAGDNLDEPGEYGELDE